MNLPAPDVRRRRPSRGPLARVELVEALHVGADGRVTPGEPGYYWHGESVALLTAGETAAIYLLGGASVPLPALLALLGVRDARRHLLELPDLPLADDWARRTWALACHGEPLCQYAAARLGERAWPIYRTALAAALAEMSPRW